MIDSQPSDQRARSNGKLSSRDEQRCHAFELVRCGTEHIGLHRDRKHSKAEAPSQRPDRRSHGAISSCRKAERRQTDQRSSPGQGKIQVFAYRPAAEQIPDEAGNPVSKKEHAERGGVDMRYLIEKRCDVGVGGELPDEYQDSGKQAHLRLSVSKYGWDLGQSG